jgi:hypothetical protein
MRAAGSTSQNRRRGGMNDVRRQWRREGPVSLFQSTTNSVGQS